MYKIKRLKKKTLKNMHRTNTSMHLNGWQLASSPATFSNDRWCNTADVKPRPHTWLHSLWTHKRPQTNYTKSSCCFHGALPRLQMWLQVGGGGGEGGGVSSGWASVLLTGRWEWDRCVLLCFYKGMGFFFFFFFFLIDAPVELYISLLHFIHLFFFFFFDVLSF